jgi:chromosome segregation ATPase
LLHSEKAPPYKGSDLALTQELELELSNQFKKEWDKLEVICTKGLEKTAFLDSKSKNAETKIKTICKVKEFISTCGQQLRAVFLESLTALRQSCQREDKLVLEVEQKNKQLKVWEATNEDMESHLKEVEEERESLKQSMKELRAQLEVLQKNEKNYELIISAKNQEIFLKDKELTRLLLKLQEKDKNFKLAESEKSLAEQLQKDAFLHLEQFQDMNKQQVRTSQNEIKSLNNLNRNLNQTLKNEVDMKKTLIQELQDLKLQLEKKDMLIRQAYNTSILEETSQFNTSQCSHLQQSHLPRLSIQKDLDCQNFSSSRQVSPFLNSLKIIQNKGNALTGQSLTGVSPGSSLEEFLT